MSVTMLTETRKKAAQTALSRMKGNVKKIKITSKKMTHKMAGQKYRAEKLWQKSLRKAALHWDHHLIPVAKCCTISQFRGRCPEVMLGAISKSAHREASALMKFKDFFNTVFFKVIGNENWPRLLQILTGNSESSSETQCLSLCERPDVCRGIMVSVGDKVQVIQTQKEFCNMCLSFFLIWWWWFALDTITPETYHRIIS